jgi:uncharacterized protein YkwD
MRPAIVVALLVALGGVAWLVRPVGRSLEPVATTLPDAEPQKAARLVAVLKATDILAAINTSRKQERLPLLVIDARLTAVAQEKLDDMLRRRYFDHQDPEGKYIWEKLKRRCAYRLTAENLAEGMADARALEKEWMSSPPHRKNILNPGYRLTGIAVSQNPLTAVVLFADACG